MEAVVEAHSEHIHREAVMNIGEIKIGISGAKRRSLDGGTDAVDIRVAALAELHVVVLCDHRPGSLYTVVHAEPDIKAVVLDILAAGEGLGCATPRRSERELCIMGSAGKGPTEPHPRQPFIHRVADPRTYEENTVRADLTGGGIGAARERIKAPQIGIHARNGLALTSHGLVIDLEAPHPRIRLKVVAAVDAADEIAVAGAIAVVKGIGKGGIALDGVARLPAAARMIPRAADVRTNEPAFPGILDGCYDVLCGSRTSNCG